MSRRPPRLRRRSISVSSTDSYGSSGEASMLFTPLNEFLSFLDEAVKPLEILAFEISHSSALISTQFFSVCTSPWMCFIARPSLLFSNFNLVRAVLWFSMTVFELLGYPLPWALAWLMNLFFKLITCFWFILFTCVIFALHYSKLFR